MAWIPAEVVRDVDDRDALPAQRRTRSSRRGTSAPSRAAVGLSMTDLGVYRERFRDLDDLLMATEGRPPWPRERWPSRGVREPRRVRRILRRSSAPSARARRPGNVLRDRAEGNKAQLLMDHANARPASGDRTRRTPRAPRAQCARVGWIDSAEDLDEGRLAGAVSRRRAHGPPRARNQLTSSRARIRGTSYNVEHLKRAAGWSQRVPVPARPPRAPRRCPPSPSRHSCAPVRHCRSPFHSSSSI